jgi:hypothetical protein
MNDIQYVFLYKLACLGVGIFLSYLGYRLFVLGVFSQAGNLQTSWKGFKLVVTKAAPGLYFILFGTIVIITTIYKGITFEEYVKSQAPQKQIIPNSRPVIVPTIDSNKLNNKQ